MKNTILKAVTLLSLLLVYSFSVHAQTSTTAQQDNAYYTNAIEELDPADPNIEQTLQEMDKTYTEETGKSPFLLPAILDWNSCQKFDCPVYAVVNKSEQRLYLYVKGALQNTWTASTGDAQHETPIWEGHPDGRIYDAYSSAAHPGGDYKGLGNMPYAVFLHGGYAIHGTPQANWPKLGTKASHGCVRVHPDNAYIFNRLVRQYGVASVWVSIVQ